MNSFRFVSVVMVGLSLAGCNIFQSKEEECLQSGRLNMTDPDSLKVVQNLGDRGQILLPNECSFWLRYSGTNSYGGRVSSNMACEKLENKWVRSERAERLALLEVRSAKFLRDMTASNDKLKQVGADRLACKTSACRLAVSTQASIDGLLDDGLSQKIQKEADAGALAVVYEDTGPLQPH